MDTEVNVSSKCSFTKQEVLVQEFCQRGDRIKKDKHVRDRIKLHISTNVQQTSIPFQALSQKNYWGE